MDNCIRRLYKLQEQLLYETWYPTSAVEWE